MFNVSVFVNKVVIKNLTNLFLSTSFINFFVYEVNVKLLELSMLVKPGHILVVTDVFMLVLYIL